MSLLEGQKAKLRHTDPMTDHPTNERTHALIESLHRDLKMDMARFPGGNPSVCPRWRLVCLSPEAARGKLISAFEGAAGVISLSPIDFCFYLFSI